MKAVILCGGFGTRLRDVIGDTQKAVAEVRGKPFLHVVIEQLRIAGFEHFVFCTHFQSEQVEIALKKTDSSEATEFIFVREKEPLGTGGAILNAIDEAGLCGDFIALNADTFVDAEAYRLAKDAETASLVVRHVDDCERYGAIHVTQDNKVDAIIEKGFKGSGFISMGIYRLNTGDLKDFSIQNYSMENDILPQLIQRNKLSAIFYNGPFIDIGTPQSLAEIRNLVV